MQRFRSQPGGPTSLRAQLGILGLLLWAAPGCLELERAHYCNRIATEIRAVFPKEKLISTGAERRQLAIDVEKLLGQFNHENGTSRPFQGELNALSQELRTFSSDLKRSSQVDSPLTLAMKKRMSESLERTKLAAERFRTACH